MDKKVEIKNHEFICTSCNGTGREGAWKAGNFTVEPHCRDCGGDGKFDWIERIVGKKKDDYWSLLDVWASEAAKKMADEIDKDIIKSICGAYKEEEEQNIKDKEDQYDNRVLSELLFHPIIE